MTSQAYTEEQQSGAGVDHRGSSIPGQRWLMTRSSKVSIIFYSVSVALLLATVGSTKVTVLDASDFLGTVSKLPPIYWLSIALLVAGMYIAYRRGSMSLCICGCVLLAAGLYVVYGFIEPAGRHWVSYETASLAQRFISSDLTVVSLPYASFLGFPILVTAITEVTNCSLLSLIRFFVPLAAVLIGILGFIFFQRASGQTRTAVIATALFIPLMGWHFFFVPQFVTYILILAFLAVFCMWINRRTWACTLLLIILLAAMIITHVLAPIAIILFLIAYTLAVLLFGKGSRASRLRGVSVILVFLAAVVAVYLVWMQRSAGYFLNWSLPQLLETFRSLNRLLQALTLGQPIVGASLTKQIQNFSQGVPFLVTIVLSVIFVLIAWRRKTINSYTVPVSYFCGALVLVLVPYGGDVGLIRVGYFVTVGAVLLSGLLLARIRRSWLVFILIAVFALVHPLAYSGSSGVTVVTRSELSGAAFLADRTKNDTPYFSQTLTTVYDNPYQFEREHYTLWSPPLRDFDINAPFVYLLHSKRDTNNLQYYLGYDPILRNMDTINSTFNLVYANGNSLIYNRVHTG